MGLQFNIRPYWTWYWTNHGKQAFEILSTIKTKAFWLKPGTMFLTGSQCARRTVNARQRSPTLEAKDAATTSSTTTVTSALTTTSKQAIDQKHVFEMERQGTFCTSVVVCFESQCSAQSFVQSWCRQIERWHRTSFASKMLATKSPPYTYDKMLQNSWPLNYKRN